MGISFSFDLENFWSEPEVDSDSSISCTSATESDFPLGSRMFTGQPTLLPGRRAQGVDAASPSTNQRLLDAIFAQDRAGPINGVTFGYSPGSRLKPLRRNRTVLSGLLISKYCDPTFRRASQSDHQLGISPLPRKNPQVSTSAPIVMSNAPSLIWW